MSQIRRSGPWRAELDYGMRAPGVEEDRRAATGIVENLVDRHKALVPDRVHERRVLHLGVDCGLVDDDVGDAETAQLSHPVVDRLTGGRPVGRCTRPRPCSTSPD